MYMYRINALLLEFNYIPLFISIFMNDSGEKLLKERGEYWLIIYEATDGGNTTIACDFVLYNDPPNIYLRELMNLYFYLVELHVSVQL